ncbi:hypothetical protein [Lentzea indica]|uniref:hypothetical protein n=1 Tax=Lentzea indica TaxID=2604800 RepID=UPI001FE94CB1|nr:hypothetical protein [Lentzea indica]
MSTESAAAASYPQPPTTSNVSIGRSSVRRSAPASIRTPAVAVNGAPPSVATVTSYRCSP